MQLLVRTLAGRTVAVQADAAERVSAFKARVAGGLTDAVRLTHVGHELDDARTIGELQLGEDAVLQAALRLNGGVMTSVKLVTPRHAAKSITVCCAAQPRPLSGPGQPDADGAHTVLRRLTWLKVTAPPWSSSGCRRPLAFRPAT